MPVDHTDFPKAAQRIRRNDGEIDRRNAASRAYYAACHRCRSIAERHGLAGSNYVQHSTLIDVIKRSQKVEDKQIVRHLIRSRSLRTKADYHLDQNFTEADATDSLGYATQIFELAAESDRRWSKRASGATRR